MTNNKTYVNDRSNIEHLPDPRVRVGFNLEGTIDLDKFRCTPIQFKDASFQGYGWLELNTIDLNDNNWKNIGIRAKENTTEEARVESFRVSFRQIGYDMGEFPPCIDTDRNILEGRGRIKAAIANGELWMPVAVYTRTDVTDRNTITNGLLANQKKPMYMTEFSDYVEAGVDLISKNQLANTKKAIESWLYNDVKISKSIDNSINGQVTRIREKILKRTKSKSGLVNKMDKSAAHKWVKDNLNLAKSDYVLVNASDNETYAERAWRSVRNALKSDKDPVNIIFYTTEATPEDARLGLTKATEYLECLYTDSWEVVKSQLPEAFSLNIPSYRPYTFMGAIPQFVKSHKINSSHLVPIKKY
jgi:hypothetical protein